MSAAFCHITHHIWKQSIVTPTCYLSSTPPSSRVVSTFDSCHLFSSTIYCHPVASLFILGWILIAQRPLSVQHIATNFLSLRVPSQRYFLRAIFEPFLPEKYCQFHTMAENFPTTTLPPPPSTAGAPGVSSPPGTNGTSHVPSMPPPTLPPVVIPQNNKHVPQPMSATTPSGGKVTRAAPEPNKRALYVGGLDPRVTEEVLQQIFETTGHVQSVKIIPDKNVSLPPIRPQSGR